jgi:hypothetical protein
VPGGSLVGLQGVAGWMAGGVGGVGRQIVPGRVGRWGGGGYARCAGARQRRHECVRGNDRGVGTVGLARKRSPLRCITA